MIPALLLAAATCVPPSSPAPVGFWESRQTSMGGIGGTLDFRADGTLVNAATVIVNFTYELDGDRLLLRGEKDPPGTAPTTQQVRIDSDAIVVVAGDKEVRKERVGRAAAGAPPIVGVFRSYNPALKSTVWESYAADGHLQLRIPIATQRGCYTVGGDRVVFDLGDRPRTKHRFVVNGDELHLESEGEKKAAEWDRVGAGAWYDVEQGVPPPPAGAMSTTSASRTATAAPAACKEPHSQELVGLWQGTPKVPPPLGSDETKPRPAMTLSFLFRSDGSFVQAMTGDSRGTYRVEGEVLERLPMAPETGFPTPAAAIALDGDHLTETAKEGPAVRLHRLGTATPGAPAIVGRWMSDPGQRLPTIYESFDEQGNWERRILVNRLEGCFELEGGSVVLTLGEGHRAPPMKYSLKGVELRLRPQVPGEGDIFPPLAKQPELAWYLAPGSEPERKPLRPPVLATLAGPEADDLLARVNGKLVLAARRALEVVDLPSLSRTTLPVNSYFWGGERFTDADANGRLLFFFAQRLGRREKYDSNLGGTLEGEVSSYTLVSIGLDGKNARELLKFESPELNAVGLDVEQSRLGRRVAYLREVDHVKVTTAQSICPVGVAKLRLFDPFWLERTLEHEAIDNLCSVERGRMLAWHPDEQRLAYLALAERTQVEADRSRLGEFGREFFVDRWERVPVVRLLDVESGQDVALGLGASVLFSDDGKKLVVGDTGNRWRTIDLESRVSTPLDLPGNWRGPVALLANGLILYLALPTAGEESASGTLKILDPATGRYQTVLRDAVARMRFRATP